VRTMTEAANDTEVEHVVTWPLHSAEDRALAQRVLYGAFPTPALGAVEARRLRDRLAREALRERRVYATTATDGGFALEVAGVGYGHTTSAVRRRLVAAEVLRGGRTARRVDCVGLERS
jgi:hypothetical protein